MGKYHYAAYFCSETALKGAIEVNNRHYDLTLKADGDTHIVTSIGSRNHLTLRARSPVYEIIKLREYFNVMHSISI